MWDVLSLVLVFVADAQMTGCATIDLPCAALLLADLDVALSQICAGLFLYVLPLGP